MSTVLEYVSQLTTCPACGHAMSAHNWIQSSIMQNANDYDYKLYYYCTEGKETCLFEGTPSGITATKLTPP